MPKKVFELAKELKWGFFDLVKQLKKKGFVLKNQNFMVEVSDEDAKSILEMYREVGEEEDKRFNKLNYEKVSAVFKENIRRLNPAIVPPKAEKRVDSEKEVKEVSTSKGKEEEILKDVKKKEEGFEAPLNTEHFFRLTVKGTEYSNSDGTSRAQILRTCKDGEDLFLKCEPHNLYDSNAVMVLKKDGQQIGYIPREDAPAINSLIRKGAIVSVKIISLKPFCNIFIGYNDPPKRIDRSDKDAPPAMDVFDNSDSFEKLYNDSCPGCGGIGCKYCSDEFEDRD